MEITITSQMTAFLYSILLGAIFGAVYGIVILMQSLFFKAVPKQSMIDIVYFLLFAVVTFLFFIAVEDGKIRGYLYFGEFLGWILWRVVFGDFLEKYFIRYLLKIRSFFASFTQKRGVRAKLLQKR